MTKPRLVATYYTLAGPVYPGQPDDSPYSLERRADSAAAVGYEGIGLSGYDLAVNIERIGAKGIRKILDDAGLSFLEIECLTDWFTDGRHRRSSDDMRKLWLDTACEIGTKHFKVVGDLRESGVSLERMADEFAVLCQQAASADVYVSLEVFPEANIRDLETGRKLMDLAAAPNGGLLIDIWHMTRPGIPYSEIEALPLHYIKHVELDDAAAEVVGTLFYDTSNYRLPPGEGSFDVPAFLQAIERTGYCGYYGVEILSEGFRAMPPEKAASLSFEATMSQFAVTG